MKKSKISEEKIIAILREGEAGMKVAELCRKHGMSDAVTYEESRQKKYLETVVPASKLGFPDVMRKLALRR